MALARLVYGVNDSLEVWGRPGIIIPEDELRVIGHPFVVANSEYPDMITVHARNANAYCVGFPHVPENSADERVFPVQMYRIPAKYIPKN